MHIRTLTHPVPKVLAILCVATKPKPKCQTHGKAHLGIGSNGVHSGPRIQLQGSLQLSAFDNQQLPCVGAQHHPLPLPLGQPGMGHVVLGVPLGQGAGQQLEAVFGSLETLEDAAAYHADNAIALPCRSRVEEALQRQATNEDMSEVGVCRRV